MCLAKLFSKVVVAAVSLHNPNTGRGSIVFRALDWTKTAPGAATNTSLADQLTIVETPASVAKCQGLPFPPTKENAHHERQESTPTTADVKAIQEFDVTSVTSKSSVGSKSLSSPSPHVGMQLIANDICLTASSLVMVTPNKARKEQSNGLYSNSHHPGRRATTIPDSASKDSIAKGGPDSTTAASESSPPLKTPAASPSLPCTKTQRSQNKTTTPTTSVARRVQQVSPEQKNTPQLLHSPMPQASSENGSIEKFLVSSTGKKHQDGQISSDRKQTQSSLLPNKSKSSECRKNDDPHRKMTSEITKFPKDNTSTGQIPNADKNGGIKQSVMTTRAVPSSQSPLVPGKKQMTSASATKLSLNRQKRFRDSNLSISSSVLASSSSKEHNFLSRPCAANGCDQQYKARKQLSMDTENVVQSNAGPRGEQNTLLPLQLRQATSSLCANGKSDFKKKRGALPSVSLDMTKQDNSDVSAALTKELETGQQYKGNEKAASCDGTKSKGRTSCLEGEPTRKIQSTPKVVDSARPLITSNNITTGERIKKKNIATFRDHDSSSTYGVTRKGEKNQISFQMKQYGEKCPLPKVKKRELEGKEHVQGSIKRLRRLSTMKGLAANSIQDIATALCGLKSAAESEASTQHLTATNMPPPSRSSEQAPTNSVNANQCRPAEFKPENPVEQLYRGLLNMLNEINKSNAVARAARLRESFKTTKSVQSKDGVCLAAAQEAARRMLECNHHAAQELIRKMLLKEVLMILKRFLDASISPSHSPATVVENAKDELKEVIRSYQELLYDTIQRQDLEASSLAAQQTFEQCGVEVPILKVRFPFDEVFKKVYQILEAITMAKRTFMKPTRSTEPSKLT